MGTCNVSCTMENVAFEMFFVKYDTWNKELGFEVWTMESCLAEVIFNITMVFDEEKWTNYRPRISIGLRLSECMTQFYNSGILLAIEISQKYQTKSSYRISTRMFMPTPCVHVYDHIHALCSVSLSTSTALFISMSMSISVHGSLAAF